MSQESQTKTNNISSVALAESDKETLNIEELEKEELSIKERLAEITKQKAEIQAKEKEDKFKAALSLFEGSYAINDFLQYLIVNEKLDSKSFVKQLIENKLVGATDFEEDIEAQKAQDAHRRISIPLACYEKNGKIVQLTNPGRVIDEDWKDIPADEILKRQTTHVWIHDGKLRGVWNKMCGKKPDNLEEYQEVKAATGKDSTVTYWAYHYGKRTKYTCKMIEIDKLTFTGSTKTRYIKKELESE